MARIPTFNRRAPTNVASGASLRASAIAAPGQALQGIGEQVFKWGAEKLEEKRLRDQNAWFTDAKLDAERRAAEYTESYHAGVTRGDHDYNRDEYLESIKSIYSDYAGKARDQGFIEAGNDFDGLTVTRTTQALQESIQFTTNRQLKINMDHYDRANENLAALVRTGKISYEDAYRQQQQANAAIDVVFGAESEYARRAETRMSTIGVMAVEQRLDDVETPAQAEAIEKDLNDGKYALAPTALNRYMNAALGAKAAAERRLKVEATKRKSAMNDYHKAATSEALQGKEFTPKSEAEYVNTYGETKGKALYADLQRAVRIGQMASNAFRNPEEYAGEIEKIKAAIAETGDPEESAQLREGLVLMEKGRQKFLKEIKTDSAASILNRSDDTREMAEAALQSNDPATWRTYVSKMKSEQETTGIPSDYRRILSKPMAAALAQRFQGVQQGEDMVGLVDQMREMFGDDLVDVMRDIDIDELPAGVAAIVDMAPGATRNRLANAIFTNGGGKDIADRLGDKYRDYEDAAQTTLEDFRGTIINFPGGQQNFDQMKTSVIALAAQMRFDKVDVTITQAVEAATDAILPYEYHPEGFRVPWVVRDIDQVFNGAETLLHNFDRSPLAKTIDFDAIQFSDQNLTPEFKREQVLRSITTGGAKWVTDAKDEGLVLVASANGQVFEDTQGKEIRLTWDELREHRRETTLEFLGTPGARPPRYSGRYDPESEIEARPAENQALGGQFYDYRQGIR